jgi:CBS-domain-containing membrane protein
MIAADLMTPDPMTVSETTSLLAVQEQMEIARVRHMPVVRGTQLIGLVTHRDVLAASLSRLVDVDTNTKREILRSIPVSEVMVRDLVTVEPTSSLEWAVNELLDRKIDCLPVIESDGTLVGILTASDFLKLTRSLLEVSRKSA